MFQEDAVQGEGVTEEQENPELQALTGKLQEIEQLLKEWDKFDTDKYSSAKLAFDAFISQNIKIFFDDIDDVYEEKERLEREIERLQNS